VGAYDPDGDGHEHDEQVPQATDGDAATFWATETYDAGLQKPGVGLVLDASRSHHLTRLTLITDTPGYTALIKMSRSSPSGPFTTISQEKTVTATTPFRLHGARGRYYLVWITSLNGVAHVNEVRARGLKSRSP